ncbi:MAG: hypothetical protein CMB80_03475 [Flammeovirgaceae bacterium]|jgi:hypothetical protein|nr:hypothetical protein [Flammeovirgaceae bacterium]|tara:strand:+ start:7613 stop:7840 length:228 start_codon:yes stop_codon:yes gene_type:complete
MDYLKSATDWLKQLLEAGVALLALAVVIQVIFGSAAPFLPGDVVGNIVAVTAQLGSQGLVGLVAIWVLVHVFNRK